MSIFTNCPGCQTALSLGDHLQGKQVRCKNCGHAFLVEETPLEASEADEVEDEGTDAPEQIQPPQPSKQPALSAEEGPESPPRRQQKRSDVPPLPPLRRHRWGLIFALVMSGLTLFLLGGAVALAILYWSQSWHETLEQLDSDFRGSWPAPEGFGLDLPEDTIVTLHVAAVEDDSTREAVYDKALTLADGGRGSISSAHLGNRMTILLGPVRDPRACAGKIDFGTVRRTYGRTISVVAHKVEGLPPDADAVTIAVQHLKSPNFMRRREAAERLKKMVPNERREEVGRALQQAWVKDASFFSRKEILEALAVWCSKDSVPFLLGVLAENLDPFTREALFNALARLQDERAFEPLARRLEDLADRHEAAEALKAMGPIAEKAVLKRLQHAEDWVRGEACKILGVIGTKESLAALEKATADGKGFVPDEARAAIQSIKARRK
jgi:hypothetical protein